MAEVPVLQEQQTGRFLFSVSLLPVLNSKLFSENAFIEVMVRIEE